MKYIYTLSLLIILATPLFSQSPGPLDPLQGGDVAANAFVLTGPLPITSSGHTSGYQNDYDETCPYSGSTAADVVYSYTPPADIFMDFDLCGSNFDTKIYVYENTVVPGTAIACNDDFHYSDLCGYYTSKIESAFLTGGNIYYIVIDGYEAEQGNYDLLLNESEFLPCNWGVDVACSPYSIGESEPCGSDLNGGCFMFPGTENWESVPSTGAIFCGSFWADFGYTDKDLYELVLTMPSLVIVTTNADRQVLYGMVETTTPGSPDCGTLTGEIFPSNLAGPCTETFLDLGTLAPGTYWFYIAINSLEGYPCDNHYSINFEVVPTGCPQPESLLASNITTSTADLSWVESGTATSWEYLVLPLYSPPLGPGTLTSSNPVTVSGLTSNTTYDFYVRAVCGVADSSAWTGPFTFTATCDGATTFPWNESFESNWPPACWNDPDEESFGWDQSTYGFERSGSEWAYCNLAGAVLATPDFLLSTDAWLVFYYMAENSAFPQDMTVRVGTDIVHQVTGATNTTYQQVNIPLSAYIGQTIFISFTGGTGFGGTDHGICVDDVSVRSGFHWTGNAGTSWDNPGNWNISEIPGQDDIVTIPSAPSGGQFPQINNGINAECYNIKIEAGAIVNVKTGGFLNVKNP
jgi:hypothetical protein